MLLLGALLILLLEGTLIFMSSCILYFSDVTQFQPKQTVLYIFLKKYLQEVKGSMLLKALLEGTQYVFQGREIIIF